MGFIAAKLQNSRTPEKKIVLSKLTTEEKSNLFEQYAIEIGQMKYVQQMDGTRQLTIVGNYIPNKDLNEGFKSWLSKK